MNSIKSLLLRPARPKSVCKRLEASRGRLYRMAFAWSHHADIADEIVQETMIKALQNADKVNDIKAIDGWLFRILSNCFIDACRKHRDHVDVDEVVLFETETPESIHSQEEMLLTVRTAIGQLPLKHRQIITLIDIENFSYAEVSNIIDIPLGTVMSRLSRARQALKQIIEDKNKKKADLRLVR